MRGHSTGRTDDEPESEASWLRRFNHNDAPPEAATCKRAFQSRSCEEKQEPRQSCRSLRTVECLLVSRKNEACGGHPCVKSAVFWWSHLRAAFLFKDKRLNLCRRPPARL